MNKKTTNKILSIIIVTFNSLSLLKQCILSIYKYNDLGNLLEIIIVDNGNDSETEEYIITHFPEIKYIKNENKGFGQANNIGAHNSTGKYLFFLNPDTIIIENIFLYTINKFEKDKQLGLLGFKLIGRNGTSNFSFGFRKQIAGFFEAIFFKIVTKLDLFIPSVMYTSGADLFISKELFYKCGKFDENIFLYNEEADLCNRVNKLKRRIYYCKEKRIIHHEGGTNSFNSKSYERFLDSYEYYCSKYGIDFKKFVSLEYRKYRLLQWISFKLRLKNHLYFQNRADSLFKKLYIK